MCLCGWRANVGGMLLSSLLILVKYYHEGQNIEFQVLKQKGKNVSNRFGQ